jgi:nitrite reductase/ring-hydroxylating ferredoxin subunit
LKEVAGEPVLFLELDGNFYAYRPGCPGCGQSLEGAALRGSELECSGCGHRFDVSRAGRCVDEAGLHLEPLPLLEDDGRSVRIALTASA